MRKKNGEARSSKPPALATARARRFCEVLAKVSRDRPQPWWTSIADVAWGLNMNADEAVLLAHECELAGLVHHDLSSAATAHRHAAEKPHSVSLSAGGWKLVEKKR